jgi:CHAT domain-containing protein/tetratricopeptide (TPR) repeat protein
MKLILVSYLLLLPLLHRAQTAEDIMARMQQTIEYFQKEDYEKVIPLADRTAADLKRMIGEDTVFYTGLLKMMAYSYLKTFRYEKSEAAYLLLSGVLRRNSGEKSKGYLAALNDLANVYEAMGRYEQSEWLMLQTLALTRKYEGEKNAGYAINLNNLAGLYHAMGQYVKAEQFYVQAKDLRKLLVGENHAEYATSLNNLAMLYRDMGQFEKAEPLYIRSKEIRRRTLGVNHLDYATSLNNLGSLYQDLGMYDKAEALALEAKDIRKSLVGEHHPEYANSLNNLAILYEETGQYTKAESSLLQAVAIWKKIYGEHHLIYARGLNNMAALYRKAQIRTKESEALYTQALELRKRILGENHPETAEVRNDLAMLYTGIGEYAKAEPFFMAGGKTASGNLQTTFSILSEKEKGNYVTHTISYAECSNSLLYYNSKASPDFVRSNLNQLLFLKSVALTDTRNMLESVRNSTDPELKRLVGRWQEVKLLLARQYGLPMADRMPGLVKAEEEAETLEKELNRRSSLFRNQQSAFRITMNDIREKMRPDEAAIEFVRFKLYRYTSTDSIMYAAYVFTKKDTVPYFVPLCEERQLQRLFDSAGKTPAAMVNSFYRGLSVQDRQAGMGAGLYRLIWQPLVPFLKEARVISYSPAGKLFSVAFYALPADSATLLIDKYTLQQFTSIRQLCLRTTTEPGVKPLSSVLFGDADFSMDSLELVKHRAASSAAAYIPASRGSDVGSWPDLPGTAEEVNRIRDLFLAQKISTQLFTKTAATEENLKRLTGKSPAVLHIATHGFFLADPSGKKKNTGAGEGNTYKMAHDPLLRSGLIFAGGNYVWSGKKPVDGVEDGIATAYEISQLNLGTTELVVLSACETALGDIKGSEGVFGLQRAFKMAGVKKMIVSLWQVPDKETAELMTAFYSYWLKGKAINEAFVQAQGDMRKKYTPYYWAAFVLVE